MNKGELHRLGEYICEVDVRNHDLQCKNLLGLSIAKEFIPSIANIIGTDLRSYKVVKSDQFAYVPVTSRNGEKITVAHYSDKENCIISQAYTVFEVIHKEVLLPDYLMLWFRRPEFDRYARYKSHGSAREVFDWDEMCDTKIPVPLIEEQRKIVNQYNAIQNRIEINKQTIARLEDAAQAIYHKLFIEGIDPENLPIGWKYSTLGEITSISAGGDRPDVVSDKYSSTTPFPIYSNGIDKDGLYGFTDKAKIDCPSVTVSARGTIGFVCYRAKPFVPIVRLLVFSPTNEIKSAPLFLTYLLKNTKLEGDGAVQLQLTAPEAAKTSIILPPPTKIRDFEEKCAALQTHKTALEQENKQLEMFSLV